MTFSAALLSLQGLAIAAPTGSVGGGSGGSDVDCVHQLKDGSNLCPRGSGGHAFPPFEGSGGGEELVVTEQTGLSCGEPEGEEVVATRTTMTAVVGAPI